MYKYVLLCHVFPGLPLMAGPPQPPLERHTEYYLEDASDVFRVENTLFRVYRGLLCRHSVVLQDMFSMPQSTKGPREGSSDDNPIHLTLNTVTVEQFSHILFFVLDPHASDPDTIYPEDMLLDVLHIGSLWEMVAARKWAIRHLQSLELPLARRIELAMFYGILDWLTPAFTTLIHISWLKIPFEDTSGVPGKVLVLLGRTKELIFTERSILALNIPRISAFGQPGCAMHNTCLTVWEDTWRKRVLPKLIHPETPLPFDEAESFLRSLSFSGMNASCLRKELDVLIQMGCFRGEGRLVSRGCNILEQWCRSDSKFIHLEMPPPGPLINTQSTVGDVGTEA